MQINISGIDEIDNKLLNLLMENARSSYSDLAEAVGLSRVAVKNRITDMEEMGLIQGYNVKLAPRKVNNAVEFIITVCTRPEHYNYIAGRLAKNKYITKINAVTGDCKMIAYGVAPNTREVDAVNNWIRGILTDVRFFSFDIVTSTYKDVDGGIEYEGSGEECTDTTRGDNH